MDASKIKTLTEQLDKSLSELRELLLDIDEVAEVIPSLMAYDELCGFRDTIDKAIDDMDDAADTLLINISRL